MSSPGTQGLAGWSFQDTHVQPEIKKDAYLSFESALVSFGPALVSDLAASATGLIPETDSRSIAVYPTGLIENLTYGGGQAVQKIFEIGSVRSYLVAGRPDGQVSLSKVLFHGPSLMRSMYASYKDSKGLYQSLVGNTAPGVKSVSGGNIAPGTVNAGGQPDHDFFFNLQHPLFRRPFGMLLYLKDVTNVPYSGIYFETAIPNAHGFGLTAGTVMMLESASFSFDRMMPINVRFIKAS